MIPYRRNPFFTGRDDILTRLYDQLQTTGKAALSQPIAMSGLGGVGKTQVAVEYAYRYRENYQAILWVNASNPQEVLEDFTKLASVLQLPEQNAQEQQQAIQAVKQWLDTHTDWLLIFDNADTLANIYDYLPQENTGHILITTRAQTMSGIAQKIEIKPMELEEGLLLLLRRAGILSADNSLTEASEKDCQAAQTIVDLMGGLPLALDQAGAYIEETYESLSNYIDIFQKQRAALLKRRGGLVSLKMNTKNKSSSDHLPVATTWLITFEKIQQTNPAAIQLIRLCAFLVTDAIPEELLTNNISLFDPLLQVTIANRDTFNTALGLLQNYSLLSRNPDDQTLSMHGLIQAVIKDEMTEEQQHSWSQLIIRMVSQMFPFDEPAPWYQSLRYILNGLLAVEYISQQNTISDKANALLSAIGTYFYRRGLYNDAERLYQRALDAGERLLGPEHPDTLSSVNNLANLYADQGKYSEAEQLHQRALDARERLLGPEHPDTLSSANNLANLYADQGKHSEAERLYQRVLEAYERLLGPEHPNTLSGMNNLAILYAAQGKYPEAERLYQRALDARERLLGPEHPDTLSSANSMANLYTNQGKYPEAERLYQRALDARERLLGLEHPDTLSSVNNLANLYAAQGKYPEAEQLYQRVLDTGERLLGPEHPNILRSVNSMANLYTDQGKYPEAERLYQRALDARERLLGLEHPDTLGSVNSMAILYAAQGRYPEAEQLYQRVLDTGERLLGLEHPNILSSVNNLANLYADQGKHSEAERLYQRVLEAYERLLGPEHPNTLSGMNNLAILYAAQGKYPEAEQLYQRALGGFEKVLGPEHPYSSRARQGYARLKQMLQEHEASIGFTKQQDD